MKKKLELSTGDLRKIRLGSWVEARFKKKKKKASKAKLRRHIYIYYRTSQSL